MFTQTSKRGVTHRLLRSPLVGVLAGPRGVDTYTELMDRAWTDQEARATVVDVRHSTPRSATLTLRPNPLCAQLFSDFRAGGHVSVSVEIDGRRHTRYYSPANAEGSRLIELTVGRHDGGRVSTYLCDHARPGTVVGIGAPGGSFTLDRRARRTLFISGGSGITPVMSMLRTLRAEGRDGQIAFVHYAPTAADACYRRELAAMHDVTVLHGYTRSADGDLTGHISAEHLRAAMTDPEAVYVCGPAALADAVRALHPAAQSESFVPPSRAGTGESSGGRVVFADARITVEDDGRPLLEQAEAAGLAPESGCRMGICHSCTRRKISGAVKNLTTGAVSAADGDDVQICVSVPVGDVEIAL